MLSSRLLSYLKKRKISRNGHSLPLVFIRCHSSSLVVIRRTTRCHSFSLVIICCHSLYHSLPFVVTCCTTRCHSLSLDVPLVCLFINNHQIFDPIKHLCLIWTNKQKEFEKRKLLCETKVKISYEISSSRILTIVTILII